MRFEQELLAILPVISLPGLGEEASQDHRLRGQARNACFLESKQWRFPGIRAITPEIIAGGYRHISRSATALIVLEDLQDFVGRIGLDWREGNDITSSWMAVGKKPDRVVVIGDQLDGKVVQTGDRIQR